jgi:hypothetical protein
LRMSLPETTPRIGVTSHYRERNRSDKRISSPRPIFLSRRFSPALAIRRLGSLRN